MEKTVDVSRYIDAHKRTYQTALQEIRNGCKRSHWMWYIFPQIVGLGKSQTSRDYAIQSIEEAVAFLNNPYLGNHLIEISQALLELDEDNPTSVFGHPDDRKLKSCMTLFAFISGDNDSVFNQVLQKFYGGKKDNKTLDILLAHQTVC